MLLQTNSYIVPKERRAEHARLLRRFRQTLLRLGCDHFEAYEQVGPNWSHGESTGRYVQIMRFKDRKHQLAVQAAEKVDPTAQALIQEFCELMNFTYQQQQGLFAVGFYTSMLPPAPGRMISKQEGEALAALPDAVPTGINTEDELEQAAAEAAAANAEGFQTLTGGPGGTGEPDEEQEDEEGEVEEVTEEPEEKDEPEAEADEAVAESADAAGSADTLLTGDDVLEGSPEEDLALGALADESPDETALEELDDEPDSKASEKKA